MDAMVEWLGERYRNGDRWLAWDVVAGLRKPLYTCRGYAEAAEWCLVHGDGYRTAVLGTVLKALRGKLLLTPPGLGRLSVVLDRYPVRVIAGQECTLPELAAGNYYPMLWVTAMYPVLEVEEYVIVGLLEGRTVRKALSRFGDFAAAMMAFVRVCATARESDRYWLMGEWGKALREELVLYRWEGELVQVNDPAEKYGRCSPVFVKFVERRGALLFFDGFLRRVRPGVQGEDLDVSLFDGRCGMEFLEVVKGCL